MGIYIFELEVLVYLFFKEEMDFFKDLFFFLLENDEFMYGFVVDGYWCDVGNLDVYWEV